MINMNLKKNLALITALAVGATLTFSNTNVSAFEGNEQYIGSATDTTGTDTTGTDTTGNKTNTTDIWGSQDESTGTADNGFLTVKKYVKITVDKQIVKPGNLVYITITGNNQCQFGSSIKLTYKNGNKEAEVVLQTNADGVSVGNFEVPSDAKDGIYTISKICILSGKDVLYDSSQKSSMKNLLPKGSIQVKTNDNQKIAPVIKNEDKDIKDGCEIDPDIDQGNAEITKVDGENYTGKIKSLGKHVVEITATGIDGTKTTKSVVINVTGEITTTSTPGEVVAKIKDSTGKNIDITVSKDVKKIDKSIFAEIKGKDKSITLKQENGAEWTFNGTDISDDANIQDLDLTVSTEDKQNSGVKDKVSKITKDAQLIQFDYHGVLPAKAQVKINVGSDNALKGKSLTLYYYNSDTNKAEKVQDGVTIDADGNVTIGVAHCSDYFLSADSGLDSTVTNTGDYSTNGIVIFGMMILAGGMLFLNKKPSTK